MEMDCSSSLLEKRDFFLDKIDNGLFNGPGSTFLMDR